jgi:hypothetical protein
MPEISAIGEQRRALRLLARNPTGCTEAFMLAHGFNAKMLGRLVLDGLALAETGLAHAGKHRLRVTWIMITDIGLRTLSEANSRQRPSARQR